MQPSFVPKLLGEQKVVLEDQRAMSQCMICLEQYGADRRGFKCSAGVCQYPACEHCWAQVTDGVCPHCREVAHPYYDRQLTDSTEVCVVFCQNADFGCGWQGQYGKVQAHLLQVCEARQRPEVLRELLATSERKVAELRGLLGEAEGLASSRQSEKLFLEAEVAEMKARIRALQEGYSRQLHEHEEEVSVMQREAAALQRMNSAQAARLELVERKHADERKLICEERAEHARRTADLEGRLAEKARALQTLRRQAEEKQEEKEKRRRRSRRVSKGAPKRGRDHSRSPRRRRVRRSSRAQTPIRRASKGKAPGSTPGHASLPCAPPCFAHMPPFPPFEEWKPPAFSAFGSGLMEMRHGTL